MNLKINIATASWPGAHHVVALECLKNATDPVLGPLRMDHVQICPQHPNYVTPETINQLQERWPNTRFRLHANPKTIRPHAIVNAVDSGLHETIVTELAWLSRLMRATGYSMHAGERRQGTLDHAFDQCRRLAEKFDCPVAIEGLYPAGRDGNMYLLSTWQEHERLLTAGVPYALDLSHMNIVARHHGRQDDLVRALLAHPQCIEIHVSDNDGHADQHEPLSRDNPPWWLDMLGTHHPGAVIFYEGDLKRPPHARRRGPPKGRNHLRSGRKEPAVP